MNMKSFVSEWKHSIMSSKMKKTSTKKLVYAAMLLAVAILLPSITGNIPKVGNALCPMHIPVLLCGFICGWPWGLAVGFIAPLLRSVLFGVPPIIPKGLSMAMELATYGIVAGVMFKRLPQRAGNIYLTLITAMLCGRVVWGLMRALLANATGEPFTLPMFVAGGFTTAIPGIILQIIAIPLIIIALQKNKIIPIK